MGCFDASKQKTTSTSYLPAQSKATTDLLNRYLPKAGTGDPMAEIGVSQRVAPMSPEQQAALAQVGQYVDVFNPQASMPLFAETGDALSRVMSGNTGGPISPEEAEATWQAFYKPAERTLWEKTIPELAERSIMPGGGGYWHGGGSGRPSWMRDYVRDWSENMDAGRRQWLWDTAMENQRRLEAGENRTLSAADRAMAYGGQPTQEALARYGGASDVFRALSPEQAQRQAELGAALEQFQAEHREMSPEDLNIIMALLNLNFQQSVGTQSGAGLGYAGTQSFLQGWGGGLGRTLGTGLQFG